MPMWPAPTSPASTRAHQAHSAHAGAPAQAVASAPGTWSIAGEHADHFGGIVVMGISELRAAAAVSPRNDGTIKVRFIEHTHEGEKQTDDSITLDELQERFIQQQPQIDEQGRTVIPPAPEGSLASRIGGVIWTMINRQLLSRETAGADVTIVCDVPIEAGMGAFAAADVAVALAMLPEDSELDHPLRARLAEVCTQAVDTFSSLPALRARHTAALRAEEGYVSIIDYSDNSVTKAAAPISGTLRAFVLFPANTEAPAQSTHIRGRNDFVDAASHAFGAESLRLLPDAPERVIDWLNAVHKVHGSKGQPAVAEASGWLHFYDADTVRAHQVARALRSGAWNELGSILTSSQKDMVTHYGLDNAEALSELALARGATAARAASAGTSNAVLAFVPSARAENFAADFAADGLIVVPVVHGTEAAIESDSK